MNAPSPAIIEALQAAVQKHWLAIANYAGQAIHLQRYGFSALANKAKEDAEEERAHLNRLLNRLEVFDTTPVTDHPAAAWPRCDVPGILRSNLQLEQETCAIERAAILTARESGDEITADLFRQNLAGSETAIAELEAELLLIDSLGLENYLANQT